jgi:hypothetical protein
VHLEILSRKRKIGGVLGYHGENPRLYNALQAKSIE